MTQWWTKNNKQGCEKGELQTLNGWDCQKSFKNWSFIKSVMLAAAYRQQEIREQTGSLVRRLRSVIQAKDGAFQISERQWEWWEGVIVYLISCVQLFATPWTIACQAPLSVGYHRQEYWSVLLFLSSGDLPKSGIESTPPAFPGGFFTIEPQGKPRKELVCVCVYVCVCVCVLEPTRFLPNLVWNKKERKCSRKTCFVLKWILSINSLNTWRARTNQSLFIPCNHGLLFQCFFEHIFVLVCRFWGHRFQ